MSFGRGIGWRGRGWGWRGVGWGGDYYGGLCYGGGWPVGFGLGYGATGAGYHGGCCPVFYVSCCGCGC